MLEALNYVNGVAQPSGLQLHQEITKTSPRSITKTSPRSQQYQLQAAVVMMNHHYFHKLSCCYNGAYQVETTQIN